MENGEWWIDNTGNETFADGDVGDTNHEMEARRAALELSDADVDDEELFGNRQLTPAQVKKLRARGVDENALSFFSKRNPDARDYALEHMGWMRIKGTSVEVRVFDDKALRRLQRADFWEEGDEEDDDHELYIEEQSTRKTWSVPFSKLLGTTTAAEVKLGRGGFAGVGARSWMRQPGGR